MEKRSQSMPLLWGGILFVGVLAALGWKFVLGPLLEETAPEDPQFVISDEVRDAYFTYQSREYSNDVLERFCGEENFTFDKEVKLGEPVSESVRNVSFAYRAELLSKTIDEVVVELDGEDLDNRKISDILFSLGILHAREGDFDTMYLMWECGGQKYGDTKAMMRSATAMVPPASVVTSTEGVTSTPKSLFTVVDFSYDRAYFWLLNAFYIDSFRGDIDSISENALADLMYLQNDNPDKINFADVENVSGNFIENLFFGDAGVGDQLGTRFKSLSPDEVEYDGSEG